MKINKLDLSILLYFIVVLIPLELRLFDVSGKFILINFKPVLLLPIIYLINSSKFFIKDFYNENKKLLIIYFTVLIYLLINSVYNHLINKIPIIIAKYFIYLFNFYFVWFVLKKRTVNQLISKLLYFSVCFSFCYVSYKFFNNEFYGFKDVYWYIILSITTLAYVNRNKLLLIFLLFLEVISLSRTGWIAIFFIFIRNLSLKKVLLYLVFTIITIFVLSNINISQLDNYLDTIIILYDNIFDFISFSFDDFSKKSLFSNASDNHRIYEIYRSIDIIQNNFIFGVGFENYSNYATLYYNSVDVVRLPHNEFLRLFSEGGIIILTLSLYLYYIVFLESRKKNIYNPFLYSGISLFLFTSSNFVTFFLFLISYFISKKHENE